MSRFRVAETHRTNLFGMCHVSVAFMLLDFRCCLFTSRFCQQIYGKPDVAQGWHADACFNVISTVELQLFCRLLTM